MRSRQILVISNLIVFFQVVCIHSPYAVALSQRNFHLLIGTRPSPLARQQAQSVATLLEEAHGPSGISTEIVVIDSLGEHNARIDKATQQLPLAMTPSVDFTSTIDNAILNGSVDVGVHSIKDIPPTHRWNSKLRIGAYLPRVCPLDVLVAAKTKDGDAPSLRDLPFGARVGSASIRRQAQLLAIRPDCRPINLRGNIQTRLKALDDGLVDALVMAKAGLDRLGIKLADDKAMTVLDSHEMLPCPGQGIVGVVCTADNDELLDHLQVINNRDSSIAAIVERAVLDAVDGLAPWDGRPPVAVYMENVTEMSGTREQWLVRALLAKPDGTEVLRTERSFPPIECMNKHDALALGQDIGHELLQRAGVDYFSTA